MSLHSLSSVNGEGSTPKDPLYKILDELRSLKLWKEKQKRKEKGKKEWNAREILFVFIYTWCWGWGTSAWIRERDFGEAFWSVDGL